MFESLHFEPLQPALGGGHTFFFRDDDADHDLPELHRLLRLFGSRCVPLSLAVVPGTLTQSGARLLRSADSGTWLELHQHGWMHTNHETRGRKCEFGPERGYDEQRADIENGMRRLAEFLDERCAPIFTPPWNRCTTDTCHALAGLGFKAISRSRTAAAIDCSIKEVSM